MVNKWAIFVRAPVAINHAVSFWVPRRAVAMASMAGSSRWGTAGVGRREVPSRPEAPWMASA